MSMDGAAAPRWTMLTIGSARLALPAASVLGVLALEHLDRAAPAEGTVGRLVVQGRDCPAYALDEELAATGQLAPQRRACVLVGDAGAVFALVCDEVHMLQPKSARVHELPAALRHGASPVRQLLFAGETMVPIASVATLAQHLGVPAVDSLARLGA
jgi:hypothetical protein